MVPRGAALYDKESCSELLAKWGSRQHNYPFRRFSTPQWTFRASTRQCFYFRRNGSNSIFRGCVSPVSSCSFKHSSGYKQQLENTQKQTMPFSLSLVVFGLPTRFPEMGWYDLSVVYDLILRYDRLYAFNSFVGLTMLLELPHKNSLRSCYPTQPLPRYIDWLWRDVPIRMSRPSLLFCVDPLLVQNNGISGQSSRLFGFPRTPWLTEKTLFLCMSCTLWDRPYWAFL